MENGKLYFVHVDINGKVTAPEAPPRESDDNLPAMQRLVGGSIEVQRTGIPGILAVFNEEGRVFNLPVNRVWPGVRGHVLFAQDFVLETGERDFGGMDAEMRDAVLGQVATEVLSRA